MSTTQTVLVVDDHPVFREGMVGLLSAEDDLDVVASVSSHREAMRFLRTQPVDLCVIDLSLRNSNGLSLVKSISCEWPETQMVVVSMHDELLYGERAYRAGASGYLMKDQPWDIVIQGIRHVLSGRLAFSEQVGKLLFASQSSAHSGGPKLSNRELEVFELLGSGQSVRKVAVDLSVSPKTVESHIASIKRKLEIQNATELVHRATLWSASRLDRSSSADS